MRADTPSVSTGPKKPLPSELRMVTLGFTAPVKMLTCGAEYMHALLVGL